VSSPSLGIISYFVTRGVQVGLLPASLETGKGRSRTRKVAPLPEPTRGDDEHTQAKTGGGGS
jgi:hypothetical protein